MKILMVLENDFPPDVRVEKEAVSLINGGHEVAIASISFTKKPFISIYREIFLYKKTISKFIYKSSAVALQFPFYFDFWIRYINEVRKEFDFDVIHIHDLPLATVGYRMKATFGVKLVVDLHENYPALVEASPYAKKIPGRFIISLKQWRKYEKEQLYHSDQIITVVDEMAERIRKLGVQDNKINIVPNLPDLRQFQSVNEEEEKEYITLFYSGGINYHRGLQVVLRALPGIVAKKRNVRLWVVGDGSYLNPLKELASKLNIMHHIKFWGWKPHAEMLAMLAKSDVALIPHLRSEQTDNSSPNKLFDYMYYQKPILASDCRSVERILDENSCGVVYKDNDPHAFLNACIGFIDHPNLKLMGNGKKAVIQKYNWSYSEKALMAIYQSKLFSRKSE